MCAAKLSLPTQSALQGIKVPSGCYLENFSESWSYHGGQILGRSIDDSLYVYIWKCRKQGSDGIFDLHVFRSHPVTRRWSEVLKVTGIEGHIDLDADLIFRKVREEHPNKWAEYSCKKALFDFERRQAGFWLLPAANTQGGIFVLWDVAEDNSNIYRIKAIDRRFQILSLGYSSYHGTFVALMRDDDRPTGRLHQILFLEDGNLEFQPFLTVNFGWNPEFHLVSFCPGSFAILEGRQLNIYNYNDNTCESFKVIGCNNYELRYGIDGEMQVMKDSSCFIFPIDNPGCCVDYVVKISRSGGHYEASVLQNPSLPLIRFREPKTGGVFPLNKELKIDGMEVFYSTEEEASRLTAGWLHEIVTRDEFEDREKKPLGKEQKNKVKKLPESWIVEIPVILLSSCPERLGVLAAKQVVKSSVHLWMGDELKTEVIAQKLGLPENVVTKYFVQ